MASFSLCISGSAVESVIELDGTLKVVYSGVGAVVNYDIQSNSPIPEETPFIISGVQNTTTTLFTRIYTADSGYAITTVPEVELTGNDMVTDNYTITKTTTSD